MIDIDEVCFKTGLHTCSLNKEFHVFSVEDIAKIKEEAVNDYKFSLQEKLEEAFPPHYNIERMYYETNPVIDIIIPIIDEDYE